jgi:hypothetical protein
MHLLRLKKTASTDMATYVPRVRSVSNTGRRKKSKHTLYVQWRFAKNRAVSEIMSKNTVEPERKQKIWHIRISCWLSKPTRMQHTPALVHLHPPTHPTTYTHTHAFAHARTHAQTQKYVILIAFQGNSGFVNAPQYYVTQVHRLSWPIFTTSYNLRRGEGETAFSSLKHLLTDIEL